MRREPLVRWFEGHPVIAGILAFILPGIPQILMGDLVIGFVFLILGFGRFVAFPAILFGVLAGIHAYWLANHVYGRVERS